ncbi:MAG: hypothetical protein K2G86_07235, partial [Prevotella sp.]|nr:hypothetical protein [Prevotella sp.]
LGGLRVEVGVVQESFCDVHIVCYDLFCHKLFLQKYGEFRRRPKKWSENVSIRFVFGRLSGRQTFVGFGLPYVRVDGKCGFVVKQKDGNMPILCFGMLPSLW